jgi:CrcB protein
VPPPHPRRANLLFAIAVGGALGAMARYELTLAKPVTTGSFPWATLAINVSGSLVLGVILTLVNERWPPTRYVRPFVATGFLGAFTTWSTFMVEADLLIRHDDIEVAAAYLLVSLVGGILAVIAGIWLGRQWPAQPAPRRIP